MLFGARTIKLWIDCKPWGYSVDDIKLAITEAAKGGCKVEGHVQTPEGAQRAHIPPADILRAITISR